MYIVWSCWRVSTQWPISCYTNKLQNKETKLLLAPRGKNTSIFLTHLYLVFSLMIVGNQDYQILTIISLLTIQTCSRDTVHYTMHICTVPPVTLWFYTCLRYSSSVHGSVCVSAHIAFWKEKKRKIWWTAHILLKDVQTSYFRQLNCKLNLLRKEEIFSKICFGKTCQLNES